jgi:hypothetical protein
MIPWINPTQRKRQRSRIGGRPPVQQQVQMPTYQPQQQGGNRYMGGSKTTTGAGQPQQGQQDSPLQGLLAAKEGYDQVQDARRGGENIKNWWNNDSSAFFDKTGKGLSQSIDGMGTGLNNFFSGSSNIPAFQQQGIINDIAGEAIGGGGFRGGLGGSSLGNTPFQLAGSESAIINQVQGAPSFAGGTQLPSSSVSGLQKVGSGSPTAAGAGVNGMGAAMSGLGVGLNVADMFDQGVTFGNATGAIGSGILGASALGIGAANAWNPVGWALLAASAADSIFDIF